MPTLESTLKELIREAVREVIREEIENGSLALSHAQNVENEKTEWSDSKRRDPLSIIRPKELSELLSISIPTLYRWITDGKLPKKVKLGPSAVGWHYVDIEKWLQMNKSHN
ncbi:MAG: AlpA family phage regulatory protein [Candidatus Paceibacterota bacterium]